ncbi:ferrous iron transporter B [Cupriavidus sp. TA19]|uniref:fimbrial protein n=1 Tax=unclassified Cupriavidus TaxID=2640874 RepID=UPI000E2EAED3|nr:MULTISPECIES: fimbrial protein [unclassified Cupriavidus]BDB23162.1 type 1 fimbrial protein [Cupriavidus sp. P-10]GLC97112.1 ferrous iron transporter B [Cupriavidus sp. TA19]
MKFAFAPVVLAASIVFAAQSAHAVDGTITFNGNISATSCTINGNGSGAKSFTVTLPTVSASTLETAGARAGRTPFVIALNCDADTGAVHTYFEPGPTTDASTGNLVLNSGAGTATNVQIGLLNSNFTPIKAGFADGVQNSLPVDLVGGVANLSYFAEYVATDKATAGAANSSVMYTIAYP